jgi:hypothetical protein
MARGGRYAAIPLPQQELRMSLKNIGTVDRAIRVIVGLALIALVFVGPQTPWGWVGVVPLLTGFISFCPLYKILGIKT